MGASGSPEAQALVLLDLEFLSDPRSRTVSMMLPAYSRPLITPDTTFR